MKDKTKSVIALLGDETLLGRELKEVIEARALPVRLTSFAASGEGSFAERDGETIFVKALERGSLNGERAILVAGTEAGAEKAAQLSTEGKGVPFVIDCTGHLAARAEAKLLAPLLDEPVGVSRGIAVLAHPAAAALALLLRRLQKSIPIRHAVANVFEPASERGKRGLTELHSQTANLLSFKPLEKEVFDAQLAFALLPRYGEDAPVSLSSIEERVARELAQLLDGTAPATSLRISQAPVFNGYSISLWVEFHRPVTVVEVEESLASAQIEIRRSNEEAPNNAAVASQSGLIAGDVRLDRSNPAAIWIWVVADNLRLIADSAADLLRNLAGNALEANGSIR